MWYGSKGLCYRRKSRYIYIYIYIYICIFRLLYLRKDKSKQNQTKLQFPSVVNKDLLGL